MSGRMKELGLYVSCATVDATVAASRAGQIELLVGSGGSGATASDAGRNVGGDLTFTAGDSTDAEEADGTLSLQRTGRASNKRVFMNSHLNSDVSKVFRIEYNYDQNYSDLNTLWYSISRINQTIQVSVRIWPRASL